MEMEDQYGMPDLRQLMNGRSSHFPSIPQPPELFSSHHRNLARSHHYDMMIVGRQVGAEMLPGGLQEFRFDSASSAAATTPTNNAVTTSTSTPSLSGFEAETAGCLGGDGGTGRWPRQETLTLLEIRSRLDPKFKEANQKGPLWDEVSRIMSEEHGYQRSGKKCREKFENLYKYYKKTKEGKAGRQDGKHYRFFRQLEALYGETSNMTPVPETHFAGHSLRFQTTIQTTSQANQEAFQSQKHCDSLSLSNSSEYDTSSSNDNDLSTAVLAENSSMEKRRKRKGGRSWKAKIKDFIDSQMRKLMEKQEAWLEKLMRTFEQKEQERMLREEEWRKQEAARIDREHKFMAKERAWIEARDAALMDALQKLIGSEVKASSSEGLMAAEIQNHSENQINEDGSEILNNGGKGESWPESEITRLIQLRDAIELRIRPRECSEEVLWEEIAGKMACLGYERSALMYKDKWDSINNYPRKTKEGYKKRKENLRGCGYFPNSESSLYNQGGAYCEISEIEPETVRLQRNDGSSPSNSNAGNSVHESCFPFLMGDGENLWENYGLKVNRGDHNQ